MKATGKSLPSAYGGSGWVPRDSSLREELGHLWGACGISSEWGTIKSVLLHNPGPEIDNLEDPDQVQFVSAPNPTVARKQHSSLVAAYKHAGVQTHLIEPNDVPSPNLMFAADLFFMTPEGAIIGRPASNIRAGEEIHVARKLSELGMPILASVRGRGTFEGADAAWLNADTVLLATGLRTNAQGAEQVRDVLRWLGVRTIQIQLPPGTMHLMGILRFSGQNLAICWPGRLPEEAMDALHQTGFRVENLPDETEARDGLALNFVTLGPNRILAPAGNPAAFAFYKNLGIDCTTVDVSQLIKAAGAIGCLTGVLERSES